MNFNKHFDLIGKHAIMSPSKYHWIRYDQQKMADVFLNAMAVERGVELHDFARRAIEMKIKLPKNQKTLNMFVNDAIGYQMTPEQPLYFSENCFGTADAIGLKGSILRIHDLKTGATPANMDQLKVYMALFCLEYRYKPADIHGILRIYQFDDIQEEESDAEEIEFIINKIIEFDKLLTKLREEG